MKKAAKFIFFLLTTLMASSAVAQENLSADSRLILILDASGSMWGQIDGVNKIVIARESVGGLIDSLPDDTEVGLIAYGHRREGDCEDIEVLQAPAALDREALKSTINSINPKGKTPITSSIEGAINLVRNQESSSIVLISDGLETCDRDPCSAVRSAREAGVPFVLHVVGFDVSGEDTSQLECTAQAGEGLYLPADDAASLSEALVRAYEKPTVPDGRLVITATAEGSLQDVAIQVVNADSGEKVDGARTYSAPETNPRSIPLEDGNYQVTVSAVGIKGSPTHVFEIGIRDGSQVERAFDFSQGTLLVGVTRNGSLSDATIRVFGQDGKQVAGGRSYTSESSNPKRLEIAAGAYDVVIKSVEIEGAPEMRINDVTLKGGQTSQLAHEFASGTLRITVMRGEALLDSTINIYNSDGASVGNSRTYSDGRKNPVDFELTPGNYSMRIQEVRGVRVEDQATVTTGQITELVVELPNAESG